MKKFTQEELADIFKRHELWLKGDPTGVRADLRGADLWGANLCRADLRRANLCGADLYGADLYGADLREANLREANLCEANLREANLWGAYLWGADLWRADLREANLWRADLCEANLREANLWGANLREANLREANLWRADLCEANLRCPIACPEEGLFTAFKKVSGNLIVKLLIPEDARRSSATSRKCRCDKAMVVSITDIDGNDAGVTSAPSNWDKKFVYAVGEMVSVDNFCEDRWNECAPGIHFFITRDEAVNY